MKNNIVRITTLIFGLLLVCNTGLASGSSTGQFYSNPLYLNPGILWSK